MNTLLASSFILAISFCAPPGIITAETVRRGSARGFVPALYVQLGSLVGDTTWAVIALTGLAFLIQNNIAKTILSLVGISLMIKSHGMLSKTRAMAGAWTSRHLPLRTEILPAALFFPWEIR